MTRRLSWLLGGLLACFLMVGTATASAPPYQRATIRIEDQQFSPPLLTVEAGTLVTWTNEGEAPSLLASSDRLWEPVDLMPEATYARFFEEPGRYGYFMQVNDEEVTGTVIVEPASPPQQDEPTPTVTATPPPVATPTATPVVPDGLPPTGGTPSTAWPPLVAALGAALLGTAWLLQRRRGAPPPRPTGAIARYREWRL